MTTKKKTRVFLLDDHDVVLRGISDLVEAEPDMCVAGTSTEVTGVLNAIAITKPDVAILDVRLGDGNGIEVCREINSTYPEVNCLILSAFADDQALVDASMAGAKGYVLKQIKGTELVDSIRGVAGGSSLLDAATVRMCIQRLKNSEGGIIDSLTAQEHKIFDLIGEGCSNRQIAAELYLAEKTVKNYVSNMLSKLGMSRRTEAAAFAARLDERKRSRYE